MVKRGRGHEPVSLNIATDAEALKANGRDTRIREPFERLASGVKLTHKLSLKLEQTFNPFHVDWNVSFALNVIADEVR